MSVNDERFAAAWGAKPPRWIRILAGACDRTSQHVVADKLGRSSGYVNRLLYRSYAGNYEEAEKLVLSILGGDTVRCPIFNVDIALKTCIRERRRKDKPTNTVRYMYFHRCPTCPNNTDRDDG